MVPDLLWIFLFSQAEESLFVAFFTPGGLVKIVGI